MKGRVCHFVVTCSLFAITSTAVLAQSTPPNPQSSSAKNSSAETERDIGQVGAAVRLSTYGAGVK